MQGELLRARRMNKEYIDFTTDSVMKEVAAYYDRHGSPNERMEAHYLLGCAYRRVVGTGTLTQVWVKCLSP